MGDLLPGYAFTPDGKAIVAAYGGKIHRVFFHADTARLRYIGPSA